jgi:hypothetical protein
MLQSEFPHDPDAHYVSVERDVLRRMHMSQADLETMKKQDLIVPEVAPPVPVFIPQNVPRNVPQVRVEMHDNDNHIVMEKTEVFNLVDDYQPFAVPNCVGHLNSSSCKEELLIKKSPVAEENSASVNRLFSSQSEKSLLDSAMEDW